MEYGKAIDLVLDRARSLGVQKLENGVELIGTLPHIAPNAWLHVKFPGLSENQIRGIERDIKTTIPIPLREFFSRMNGLTLFSTSLSVHGLRRGFERRGDAAWQPFDIVALNTRERPAGAKNAVVFFGSYEWDGSKLYMDPSNFAVYRCLRRSAEVLNSWTSLDEMFTRESVRLAALFDSDGLEIDPEYPKTPPPDTEPG